MVDSVSDQEKKRQEAINEVIYTERDFVRDMEYLRDVSVSRMEVAKMLKQISALLALDQALEHREGQQHTTHASFPTPSIQSRPSSSIFRGVLRQ